ncbi:MAG: MBL fold metallo-hydrolase [Alphaproteobacteria bacterium]|nr:MBL fold metallo-hydrolase [Alphaproteobacteria bacterium]
MKRQAKLILFVSLIPISILVSLVNGMVSKPLVNPDFDPTKPHHRKDGFANRYLDRMQERKQRPNVFKWMINRKLEKRPPPRPGLITGVAPNLPLIHQTTEAVRVTWVGHSTLLLQIDGVNILTDPIWSQRASPLASVGPKRHQPPGIGFAELPHIDLVLISHNHYDHLDEPTVQRLMNQPGGSPQFIVPLGVNYWFRDSIKGAVIAGSGQNVQALDWDQSSQIAGKTAPITIEFLAVQHWSARGLNDRYATLWGSYAILHPKFKFWFAGDLGYSKDSQDIGARIGGFDLAAIPIGAYDPAYIMKKSHINPSEAVQVFKDVQAKQAFGIHWGTFEGLTDEPLDEPPQRLAKAREEGGLAENQFFVLKHGETFVEPR